VGFDSSGHGFLLANGSSTTISFDAQGESTTSPVGINNSRQITVRSFGSDGLFTSFIYNNGSFTPINVPGARETGIGGINNADRFVGWYVGEGGRLHGYINLPTEAPDPASVLLLASGLGVLAALRTRGFRCSNLQN
jgi:hypothetical protein